MCHKKKKLKTMQRFTNNTMDEDNDRDENKDK